MEGLGGFNYEQNFLSRPKFDPMKTAPKFKENMKFGIACVISTKKNKIFSADALKKSALDQHHISLCTA